MTTESSKNGALNSIVLCEVIRMRETCDSIQLNHHHHHHHHHHKKF